MDNLTLIKHHELRTLLQELKADLLAMDRMSEDLGTRFYMYRALYYLQKAVDELDLLIH